MPIRRALLGSLLLFGLLAGCDQQAMLEKLASPQERATAQRYIEALREGRFDDIQNGGDETIRSAKTREILQRMAAMIPKEEPKSVKLVGAYTARTTQGTRKTITFEYQFPTKWLLIGVTTQESDGKAPQLIGMNVNPEKAEFGSENQFSLRGKTAMHYVVLTLVVLLPLLTLYALVLCIITPLPRRKWLWVIFILFGFGGLTLNWTTGEWSTHIIYFLLFSAAGEAQYGGPWIFTVAIPLGAIVFLARRRSLMAAAAAADDAVAPQT